MNRAIIRRFVGVLLCVVLVSTGTFADETLDVVIAEKEKTLRLAERMESYGYYKSALHYYKILELQTNLSEVERKDVELKIKWIERKIEKKYSGNKLPDLDEMLHVKKVKTKPKEEVSLTRPETYPSTRIDKKKWFIGAVVVIGIGLIAYSVDKNLRKKEEKEPGSIRVEF